MLKTIKNIVIDRVKDVKKKSKMARDSRVKNIRNIPEKPIPEHLLDIKSHKLLKAQIKAMKKLHDILSTEEYNIELAKFVDKINYVINKHRTDIIQDNNLTYNYYLGGSKAWYNIFEDLYQYNILSLYEKSAVHNTTCDICYYINNIEYYDVLYMSIETALSDYKSKINRILQPDSIKELVSGNYKIELERTNYETKYSRKKICNIVLHLIDNNNTEIPVHLLSIPIISVKLNFSSNTEGDNYAKILDNIDKIIEPKSKRIEDKEIILNYLNVYGLYLDLEYSKYYIKEGYNVYKIRDYIYENYILITEYKLDTLEKLEKYYKEIYETTSLFDNKILISIQKKILLNNSELSNFINDTEKLIIEKLRPYINQTIYKINKKIKSDTELNTGIFIAGGDAIRRYDNTLSETKDIDAKIYVPVEDDNAEKINEKKQKLNNYIYEEIINLIIYLIYYRRSIFEERIRENKITIQGIEYKIVFELYNLNDTTNFRFRQLKTPFFPVDLYSGDYEITITYTKTNLTDNTIIYNIVNKYVISFLDIAVELLKDIKYNYYEKYAIKSNKIYIASLDFLLNDLNKTYNSDKSSLLRFLNNKIKKDFNRYKSLLKLKKSNKFKKTQDKPYKLKIENEDIKSKENRIKLDAIIKYDYNSIRDYNLIKSYYEMKYNKARNNKNKILFNYNMSEINDFIISKKKANIKKSIELSKEELDDEFELKVDKGITGRSLSKRASKRPIASIEDPDVIATDSTRTSVSSSGRIIRPSQRLLTGSGGKYLGGTNDDDIKRDIIIPLAKREDYTIEKQLYFLRKIGIIQD